MKDFFRNGAGGIAGLLGISLCDGIATTVGPSAGVQQMSANVTSVITLICTVAVTLTTCALQIYTMWKKRNDAKVEAEKAAKAAEGKNK